MTNSILDQIIDKLEFIRYIPSLRTLQIKFKGYKRIDLGAILLLNVDSDNNIRKVRVEELTVRTMTVSDMSCTNNVCYPAPGVESEIIVGKYWAIKYYPINTLVSMYRPERGELTLGSLLVHTYFDY